MHALPSGLRTTTPRIDGMRARFPRFPHPPPPLRRCLWEGWEGRPRPHPPAAPGPSHSERARARFPRFPQDPTAIPAALRPTDPRHNAPPPPAGGGENQNRPQTRRVCGIAASQTSPVLPPCILMESPPGELASIAAKGRETPIADRKKARGPLTPPTSGRHSPAQRGETAYRCRRRSAGTAWNADLWSAQPAVGGRSRVSPHSGMAPTSGRCSRRTRPRGPAVPRPALCRPASRARNYRPR